MPPQPNKIVWHSNSPWSPTGYGVQTRVFLPLLHEAGWKIAVSAYYGLQGAPLNTQYATIYPVGLDTWGNDMLPMHYKHLKPDVMFLLHDIWVIASDVLRQFPASSWCPVDHQPIPPQVLEGLKACRWPIAMSKFGEMEMRKAGLDPFYIPHGIDTEMFAPCDRSLARQAWGVPEDVFLAVVVAANKGNPSRKSLDRILKAWGKFVETHPKSILYMHTLASPAHGGWDVLSLAGFYGIPPENLRLPDTYKFLMGEYGWDALAHLYNAADVKVGCSMGEGFGITEIEAQASGCPVIVTDFSAQSELCFGGYKIPIDPMDEHAWTYQDSEQALVPPSKILTALEWAHHSRGDTSIREQARAGALDYDARRVFDRYMHPVLKYMAEVNRAERGDLIAEESQNIAQEATV